MEAVKSLELKLNEMLVKNAPFQLPVGFKKWVAEYAWILAIIGAVLGGFAFLGLLSLLGIASVVAASVGAGGYVLFAWLALIVLGIEVALMIMAISPLKAKQKRGWDLMFYSQLISIAYTFFNWLQAGSLAGSIFSLVWSVFWVIVGLYVLFQVREGFVGAKAKA